MPAPGVVPNRMSFDIVPLVSHTLLCGGDRRGCAEAYQHLGIALTYARHHAGLPRVPLMAQPTLEIHHGGVMPSWQAALRGMSPPPWFPSSGWAKPVSASDPLPVAIAVPVELYDSIMLPAGAPGGSAASISHARALLSTFYDRLHWLVSSNQNLVGADAAGRTPLPSTPTMREWTPPNLTRTAYVSITRDSSLCASEVSKQLIALNDPDVK
jgi:hypothetical protein